MSEIYKAGDSRISLLRAISLADDALWRIVKVCISSAMNSEPYLLKAIYEAGEWRGEQWDKDDKFYESAEPTCVWAGAIIDEFAKINPLVDGQMHDKIRGELSEIRNGAPR